MKIKILISWVFLFQVGMVFSKTYPKILEEYLDFEYDYLTRDYHIGGKVVKNNTSQDILDNYKDYFNNIKTNWLDFKKGKLNRKTYPSPSDYHLEVIESKIKFFILSQEKFKKRKIERLFTYDLELLNHEKIKFQENLYPKIKEGFKNYVIAWLELFYDKNPNKLIEKDIEYVCMSIFPKATKALLTNDKLKIYENLNQEEFDLIINILSDIPYGEKPIVDLSEKLENNVMGNKGYKSSDYYYKNKNTKLIVNRKIWTREMYYGLYKTSLSNVLIALNKFKIYKPEYFEKHYVSLAKVIHNIIINSSKKGNKNINSAIKDKALNLIKESLNILDDHGTHKSIHKSTIDFNKKDLENAKILMRILTYDDISDDINIFNGLNNIYNVVEIENKKGINLWLRTLRKLNNHKEERSDIFQKIYDDILISLRNLNQ